MDEKLSYKALISQFTTKVPSGRFSLTSLASTSSKLNQLKHCQNMESIT